MTRNARVFPAARRARRFRRNRLGQSLTEYVIIMGTLTLICIFLIDPNNGIYEEIRAGFDRVMFMLVYPGP